MSILGNRVIRREDPAFLTVGGTYIDDLPLENAVHVAYAISTMAHARITSIDTSVAASMPGVLAVVTAADLRQFAPEGPPMPMMNQQMVRTLLASDVVRFVGEPVVAVVTEERYQGEDAAEAVVVEYEPLPVLLDPEASISETPPLVLHDAAGTNQVLRLDLKDKKADFSACEVVVNGRFVNQRIAPAPLEGRAGAAYWDGDRLVHYSSCQGPHVARDSIAKAYGLETENVRVITKDVGGSFGAKARPFPEELLLGYLSRRVGLPVKWSEPRTHNMVGLSHGRGQIHHITIGGSRDGHINAYHLDVVQDAGAYPMMGSLLPAMTRLMITGCYDIASVGYQGRSAVTNTTPVGAFRGAGRPEAAAAIERAVDLFAAEIGMDPAEVRRRNLLQPSQFPRRTPGGANYDVGDYQKALELALSSAGYEALRSEQAARRASGARTLLGIGLSCYVEVTAGGGGGEFGSVEARADGTFLARTGSTPFGQGHLTTWAQLAAQRLGVSMDKIEVIFGDTDLVPKGGLTGGSRSVQLAGSAIWDASGRLLDRAKAFAAELLEASPDDIVHDEIEGRFHVAGTPSVFRSWADLAAAAAANGDPLEGISEFAAQGATFPFGAHVAVVEVDVDTGRVEVVRFVAVDDAGTIINPLLAEGQIHGGLAQGIAQALLEEVRYDEDGNPLTANFADYGVISATELPQFELVSMETPTFMNPLGAKGIGESGTVGATPAVQNAVVDALSHLGVRHVDMPCTSERVWRAMNGGG